MADYTLSDLEALTGLPARTIRYYVAQGLIASPGREGPSTRYPEQTLQRLRLIARLRDAHLPLAAIRTRLASLDEGAIASLAEAPLAAEPPAAEPASALDYIRTVLAGQAGSGAMAMPSAIPLAPSAPPAPSAPAPQPMRSIRASRGYDATGPADVAPLLTPLDEEPAAHHGPAASAPAPAPSAPARAPSAPAPAPQSITPPQAPSLGERSQWERIAIANDIELHVRRPLTRADNRLVERLIAFARQLQEDMR